METQRRSDGYRDRQTSYPKRVVGLAIEFGRSEHRVSLSNHAVDISIQQCDSITTCILGTWVVYTINVPMRVTACKRERLGIYRADGQCATSLRESHTDQHARPTLSDHVQQGGRCSRY